MFRSLMTLMRGRAHDAEEAFTDTHALPILKQQLRDCAQAVSAARKALALAIAQNDQEIEQFERLTQRIADLEDRTIAALEQGQQALALEAAETIARLQTDQESSRTVLDTLRAEVEKLRASVLSSEERLRALKRGERIAMATDKAQRVSHAIPGGTSNALRDAEETLTRLRARQTEVDATNEALGALENTNDTSTLREKLAAAGCGAPLKTTAEAVLERLRNRTTTPA